MVRWAHEYTFKMEAKTDHRKALISTRWQAGWARTVVKTRHPTSLVRLCHHTHQRPTGANKFAGGIWAGTIGTTRLLKLFEKYKIKATWFIPGNQHLKDRSEAELTDFGRSFSRDLP